MGAFAALLFAALACMMIYLALLYLQHIKYERGKKRKTPAKTKSSGPFHMHTWSEHVRIGAKQHRECLTCGLVQSGFEAVNLHGPTRIEWWNESEYSLPKIKTKNKCTETFTSDGQ